jgi:hypothetical protein
LPLHILRGNLFAGGDVGFGNKNIDGLDLRRDRLLDRWFFRPARQQGGNSTRCNGDGQHYETCSFHTLTL